MIESVFARFGLPSKAQSKGETPPQAPAGAFPLPANRFLTNRERKVSANRAEAISKKFVHPGNTRGVIEHLPADGERTHCIVRGDFVLCDLIPAILSARGASEHVRAVSLGVNPGNIATLCGLLQSRQIGRLDLLLSHYFQRVDSEKWDKAKADLLDSGLRCRLRIARCHAKVILLPTSTGDWFCIEGSANLRASNNVEQFVVFNDRATHDFHAAWVDTLLGE